MRIETQVAPPNSLILVMDPNVGTVPESMGGGLVAATSSCIAVGTLAEHDGTTTLRLENLAERPAPSELVYEGRLDTPNHKIAICSVFLDPFLIAKTQGDSTLVRIWANDLREPDLLVVQIS